MTSPRWPASAVIRTGRLTLEPIRVDHADEVAPALDDERLHEYIGGRPASAQQMRERYARLAVGHSEDGTQGWFNWVARARPSGSVVGVVQATLQVEDGCMVGQIAWVVAVSQQGQGYATEAAAAMAEWLLAQGTDVLVAYVHPGHGASIAVARRLGLAPTSVTVDGETRWESGVSRGPRPPGSRRRAS